MTRNTIHFNGLRRSSARDAAFGSRRLWPGDHIFGSGLLSVGIILLVIVLAGAPVAAQQDGRRQATGAPTVDWSHGKQAHRLVAQWVHNGQAPRQRQPSIAVRGVSGVKVTLRSMGQFAGSGAAYRSRLADVMDQPGPTIDLVPLLKRAAQRAMTRARNTVLDAQLQSVLQGIEKQTPGRPTMKQIGPRLQVGVQIARTLTPIRVGTDGSLKQVYAAFAPGYHGLRLVAGPEGSGSSFVWPATVLANNTSPQGQLTQLLDGEGLGLTARRRIAKPEGPALQRFKVIHYARPRANLPVQRLVRGNVVLPPHTVSEATLSGMADRLTRHLQGRFISGGRVRGTFQPSHGSYDPTLAPPQAKGLACYALTRRAALMEKQRPDQGKRLAETALKTATQLGRRQIEAETLNPGAAALVILTLVDTPLPDADQTLRDQLVKRLQSLHQQEGAFHKPGQTQTSIAQGTGALMTAALAAVYEQTRSDSLETLAVDATHHAWRRMKENLSVAAMPWLGLAHLRLTGLPGADGSPPKRVQQRRAGMRKLLEGLVARQVVAPPSLGPSDVVGGFALREAPDNAPPAPNWHSAQVLALLATSMRDDRLMTEQNTLGWVLTGGLAARFLGQLMMAEPSCFYVPAMEQATGGVRLSLWNNHQPVAATAMSLIAVSELQATIDAGGDMLPSGNEPAPMPTFEVPEPETNEGENGSNDQTSPLGDPLQPQSPLGGSSQQNGRSEREGDQPAIPLPGGPLAP